MDTRKYINKYVSILGDSISTFEGYSQPKEAAFYTMDAKIVSGVLTSSHTWWGQILDKLGANLLVNNSISGSTAVWHPAFQIPSYGCSKERTGSLDKDGQSPDVIIVFLGTNDWGAGVPIIDEQNMGEEFALAFFKRAYQTMLARLRKNYPNAEIWCLTLAVSRCSASKTFIFTPDFGGRHIAEYCDAIRESAAESGCKLIDLYNTAEPYDTIDGCHPNASGMQTLANAILKALESE